MLYIIGIAGFIFLLSRVDWVKAGGILRTVDKMSLLIVTVFVLSIQIFKSFRWRSLVKIIHVNLNVDVLNQAKRFQMNNVKEGPYE